MSDAVGLTVTAEATLGFQSSGVHVEWSSIHGCYPFLHPSKKARIWANLMGHPVGCWGVVSGPPPTAALG